MIRNVRQHHLFPRQKIDQSFFFPLDAMENNHTAGPTMLWPAMP